VLSLRGCREHSAQSAKEKRQGNRE
jgi:hypothetical protein